MIALALALATTLTLDEAVERARTLQRSVRAADDAEIDADLADDGGVAFDDLRLTLEHRGVDHFFAPRIDDAGRPLSPIDNVAVGATLPLPRLDESVRRSSAPSRARAARAARDADVRDILRETRALVIHVAALTRELALTERALAVARRREELLSARQQSGTATLVEVDDAARDRLAWAADLVGVSDELARARLRLATLAGESDVDDDIEARCLAPLPSSDEVIAAARAHDPRRRSLLALDEALAREDLAWRLSWIPWPARVVGTFINQEPGRVDDVRVQLDIDVPLFRVFDGEDDALALRRRANQLRREALDGDLARQAAEWRRAAEEQRRVVGLLELPPAAAHPVDPAEQAALELDRLTAEQRRLRAIARCAGAVVDVLSLVSE